MTPVRAWGGKLAFLNSLMGNRFNSMAGHYYPYRFVEAGRLCMLRVCYNINVMVSRRCRKHQKLGACNWLKNQASHSRSRPRRRFARRNLTNPVLCTFNPCEIPRNNSYSGVSLLCICGVDYTFERDSARQFRRAMPPG